MWASQPVGLFGLSLVMKVQRSFVGSRALRERLRCLRMTGVWIVWADNRAGGRLESNWPRGSLRGLNLLLRLTQGLRPGLIYVAPSGLDFGGAVSVRFD